MLSRRIALACAVTGALSAPTVPAVFAAAAPSYPLPTAGCFNFTDPKGDAQFVAFGSSELDITGIALETTPTSLLGFAKVPALSADGPGLPFDGQRFTLKFTFNGHVFSAAGSAFANGTGAIRDGLAQTGHAGHETQLGVDTPPINPTNPDPSLVTSPGYVDSGLKVTFDYKNAWVIWDLPIADIEKYGQAKFTGGLTAVGAQSQTDEYAVGSVWDSAPDTDANGDLIGSWTVGDNECFGTVAPTPIATVLKLVGTGKKITAALTDKAGKAIPGQKIGWSINGKSVLTTTTDAHGHALFTRAKKGDHVVAVFKSVKGKYVGSRAKTTA